MKTKLFKTILALTLALIALPMMGQDFMNVFFKDGTFRKFYMRNVTEIITSKLDADGVQHTDYDYQHVTTIHDKYVYSLEDVDSITFTKIDEEKAKQNFVSAMPVVFDAISGCESIKDVSAKIEQIKKAEGVADAWSDGHQLYVAIAQDEVYSFHFNHDSDLEKDGIVDNVTNQVRALLPQMKTTINEDGTRLKAVIANVLHKDEHRLPNKKDYFDPLFKKMMDCDITVHYVGEPTIDFFYEHCKNPEKEEHLNLYDYDIIFLITHGGYGTEYLYMYNTQEIVESGIKWHDFATSEDVVMVSQKDQPSWSDYYQVFKNWRDESKYKDATDANINYWFFQELRNKQWVWVAHPTLTETFFRHIVQPETKFSNPNSVFFNVSCQSLMGDTEDIPSFVLAEEFTKRNLGTYLGYDESNGVGHSAGYHLFENMLSGMSLKMAYDQLPEEDKHDDSADLLIYPQNAETETLFFTKPYTEEITDEVATSDFNELNMVMLTGTATLLDFDVHAIDGVKVGFALTYHDPVAHTQHINTDNATVLGNNKVKFVACIENLERNRQYSYCAYTYDGKNYNYGKVYSFKIDKLKDLELSAGSFCIYNGESATIDITGNGEYDIFKGNEKVTKVTLDGEKLIIEGIGAGESTIIVTDKKTGQTAPIEVTVWARLSIAIIGNIDLEVGDKANVRIMSGNNDYTLNSDYPEVATPTLIGEFVSVEALSAGKATITVTDNKTGQTASFTVTVTDSTPVDMPAAAVDLGLPSGTLWANKNVGAASPEKGGLYFAWGEIVGYGSDAKDGRLFDWDSYKWDNFTKYCSASWVAELGMGIVDNKTILDPEDDAATANWGENWRMPTYEEFRELLEYTTNDHTYMNGEGGRVYKSLTNGNSIFLPYTGYRADDFVQEGWAHYWSSTQVAEKPDLAYKLTVDAGHTQCGTDSRVRGFLVRPVFCGSGGQLPTYDNLQLSTYDPITMNVNAGLTFMILSGSGSYAVGSSKETVATVVLRDNYVDVSGVGVGTATITVIDTNTGQKKTREVTVLDNTLPDTPAEAIDLGLPSGTLWASFNVGATKPEEYGGYYSWGEIVEKDKYEWSDYLYCDGSVNTCKELGMDIAGTQYDIAHVKWGGDWRMPTYDQQQELVNNTKFKYVTLNGIKGYELVGPNGNSIFLPASGIIQANRPNVGSLGGYWSSTRDPEDPNYACNLLFRNTGSYEVFYYRCMGLSVRPVISRSQ